MEHKPIIRVYRPTVFPKKRKKANMRHTIPETPRNAEPSTGEISHINFICNTCVGGRVYQARGEKFCHPFNWVGIWSRDFVKMINQWDDVNWENIVLTLEHFKNREKLTVRCGIDNRFVVHFSHYAYDPSSTIALKETVNGVNVFKDDIIGYTREKYFERLARGDMKNPVFIIVDTDLVNYEDLKEITNKKYKIYFITLESREYEPIEGVETIRLPHKKMPSTVNVGMFFANEIWGN
jgi:uncharacterized protein (DUF1919 family)